MKIEITPAIFLNNSELSVSFVRAPGPGGQNVNKLATAVQLRFNVLLSPSLPAEVRSRLLILFASKLTQQGELIIKASRYRTQERNKQDAIERLVLLLRQAAIRPKKRKKTKPTRASKERHLASKKLHGKTKALRGGRINHNQ